MNKVRYYLVTPIAVRIGIAFSTSPKEAYELAKDRAYEASAASGRCESVGVEGATMWRDGKMIYDICDL